MGRFSVVITNREKNPHSACFEDAAKATADALRQLGHEVCSLDNPGRYVIFGGGTLTDEAGLMPADAIIFNAEQVSAEGGEKYINPQAVVSNHVTWDYSQQNAAKLRELGVPRVVHCPIGYIPSMTKIEPAPVQDIDVLFYGSVNPRRRVILDDLDKAGLNLVRLFGVYGADRDAVIARSKIVLNLHHFERPIFEIFRCSHLFANKKCVVSEDGGQDEELEAMARRATEYVPTAQIVDACRRLIGDDVARKDREDRGFFEFAKTNFVENVRSALGAS